MIPPRGGRGIASKTWVAPHYAPRGPSIMNSVKRDSIGDDRSRIGPPSGESTESALEQWRRNNASTGVTLARAEPQKKQNTGSSNMSPDTRERGSTGNAIKVEESDIREPTSRSIAPNQENEAEESDEAGGEEGILDEEDLAERERKHNREMQALEARRPPTPRSNPILLGLLEELDALASALEEKTKMAGSEEPPAQPLPLGLPSPNLEEGEEMDFKREFGSPPLSLKARRQTPPIESLPFLVSGPLTPFSDIDELQEDPQRKEAVEGLLVQRLTRQRGTMQAENDEAKDIFSRLYKPWRESVEAFEDVRRAEETMVVPDTTDDVPLVATVQPVGGRRGGKNVTELALQEVIRVSQETAAREERARREREQPVWEKADTFNAEREAEVPPMLSREEQIAVMFTDINTLVDREHALEALEFIPKKDNFTPEEHEAFLENYILCPKRFGVIADALEGRDFRDCVQHYYSTKLSAKYKDQEAAFLRTRKGKRIASSMRGSIRPRSTGLISSFDGMVDYNSQTIALTEKGRPRRAAAPTFGDAVEPEPAPTATPARRGAASKESLNGNMSAEKPAGKRTRTAPAKEKPGRKGKAPLLAAAPGPSLQKGVVEDTRGMSREPQFENKQRLEDIEGAQALAGLNGGQLYNVPVLRGGFLEGWTADQQAPMNFDPLQKHNQQTAQDQPQPPQTKTAGQPTTSSYWSVPETEDLKMYLSHFGLNWQAIAASMKTKTHTMVGYTLLYK